MSNGDIKVEVNDFDSAWRALTITPNNGDQVTIDLVKANDGMITIKIPTGDVIEIWGIGGTWKIEHRPRGDNHAIPLWGMSSEYRDACIGEPGGGNMLIEELNLSTRSYNCLKRAGIATVEQLNSLPDERLKMIRGIDHPRFVEIRDAALVYGKIGLRAPEEQ